VFTGILEKTVQLAGASGQSGDTSLRIAVTLTLLALLPTLVLTFTPMVRLLVVFHFLRQALGTQTAPGNQVLLGLGLLITWYVVQPTAVVVNKEAIEPYQRGIIGESEAFHRAVKPTKSFLLKYAREKDLALFSAVAVPQAVRTPEDLPLRVVAPAYVLSELRKGFQMGAILFLPFLLVDIVVAAITTSMGMMQLPPASISTPLKIVLFVMVDGWNAVTGSLLKGF